MMTHLPPNSFPTDFVRGTATASDQIDEGPPLFQLSECPTT